MTEQIIIIEDLNPQEVYGPNNNILELIKSKFPKLRIIARGEEIKVLGEESEINDFTDRFKVYTNLISRGKQVNDVIINDIFGSGVAPDTQSADHFNTDNVILYGNNAKPIRAKTKNQIQLVKDIEQNDIIFAMGPAGTGKTYTAVAVAVRALKNKEIKRLILTRPAVEAGENLGFLPGDLKEKIDPYLRPLYDALEDMIQPEKLKAFLENRTIEIAPMAFMRGRTLDNCYVILDEAQNSTDLQLKMFLTRMGPSAKLIITGDMTQVDLPTKQTSGLIKATRILQNIKGIKMVTLTVDDVVRHRIVKDIIKAYDQNS
ncbi:MAG: PhoH family protein [Bacteroidia bacterium]|nr:PhoH family protein [Bacteroidia bacterium]